MSTVGLQSRDRPSLGTAATRARAWRARAWRPLVPIASVYAILIGPVLATRGPLWFVHLGAKFLVGANSSTTITPALGAQSPFGYDGQFYFAVAADPTHAHDYISGMDISPGIVYSRILYPAVARLLGGGTVTGISYALLAINLLAVAFGSVALGSWLRRRGTNPACACLYALFPGLVFCVFRDLTEPLAYGLVALAVWVYDRPRALVPTALLLALAMLTRETTSVCALGFAITVALEAWRRGRRLRAARRAALFLAISCSPLLVWRIVVMHWLGTAQEQPHEGIGYLLPFHAYFVWWPWQPMRTIVVTTVLVPTVLAAIGLIRCFKGEPLPIVLFLLNSIVFVAYLPAPVLVDYGAAGRSALGVVLAFVLCLPALLRDRVGRVLAFVWSPAWYLVAYLALGMPGPRPTS